MTRKCPSCGRWFKNKHAVRAHLRFCEEYKEYKLTNPDKIINSDLLPEWTKEEIEPADFFPEWTKEEIEPADTKEEEELLPKWTRDAE